MAAVASEDLVLRPGLRNFTATHDVAAPAETAFGLVCAVEKWPVWLSFVRSARPLDRTAPLAVGSEIVLRSTLPGEEEQLYEVDAYLTNHHLSLVGAYSVRRRIEFRIERKTAISRVHARVSYPSYHGRFGALMDRWKNGRKIGNALEDALVHFKGMVEMHDETSSLAVIDLDC
ncbi:MAG: SRPBCC family protein [Vulcanimicrobiaceae bacterium]